MADRSVLVPMTLSDLERRDARGQMFPTDLCNYAHTFRHRTTTIGKVTCSGGLFLGVRHVLISRGWGSASHNFCDANDDARCLF